MKCPKCGICPKTQLSYDGDECEDCEYHVFDYRGLRCNYEEMLKEIRQWKRVAKITGEAP